MTSQGEARPASLPRWLAMAIVHAWHCIPPDELPATRSELRRRPLCAKATSHAYKNGSPAAATPVHHCAVRLPTTAAPRSRLSSRPVPHAPASRTWRPPGPWPPSAGRFHRRGRARVQGCASLLRRPAAAAGVG
eukprot:CAMPEP_0176259752 /NCGR_PEP_ID=MMETSP0121_2-20121125/39231_1 /TAXON_ID=160619 /ORGANISM="Kryptoperidinium foliaceum, Strain CCMP 1326" /LENGTH=133 /DNA_ID=CAMNT_0017599645 /DNA_START=29 /DNA_END=426 /DNA_ORIENTATION=+